MNETVTRIEWLSLSTLQACIVVVCLTATAFVLMQSLRRAARVTAPEGTLSFWQDRRQLVRWLSLGLSMVALVLLAAAVLDFRFERGQSAEPGTVVVVVDDSASVRRDGELRRRQLDEFSSRLTAALQGDQVPRTGLATPGSVRLVRFSESAFVGKPVPLSQLSARLFESGGADGGTDIASALECAAEALDHENGRGAIVLCSDGNQTSGDALAAARRLAERGVAVHVYPIESPGPVLFMHGVSAPPTVRADAQAVVRGLIRNSSADDRRASLQFAYHHNKPGEATPILIPPARPTAALFRAGRTRDLRQKLSFRGRGLHCVEVKLTATDANRASRFAGTHRVTLPVYVQGRPRILVIGNDTHWTSMIDRNRWDVVLKPPAQALETLTATAVDYDAIVLSAVSAHRLDEEFHRELRRQVESAGTGLLLINGDHAHAGEKDPSVLMSYLKTDLEPILSVRPGPRKHIDKPPARRVVITVDASGSMDGEPMRLAHGICAQIIDKLRPIDSLEIIAFDQKSRTVFPEQQMTKDRCADAKSRVSSIVADGGTDPDSALGRIQGLNLTDGALVMIGDGDMSYDYARKLRQVVGSKVYTMAFGAGLQQIGQLHPMYHFDGRMAIPNAASLPGIAFKPVESEKRERFFEREAFLPGLRLTDDVDRARCWLPSVSLQGHAVSTLSSRQGTRMIGLHPKHSDPILVFGDARRGRVGVFAAGIPTSWHTSDSAKKAVSAWLEEVSAFRAKDRYWMDASLNRERLEMRLVAFHDDGTAARLDRATVNVRVEGRDKGSVTLEPDDRGVLAGSLAFQTPLPPGVVHLAIEERGPRGETLTRPQRIPVLLPADDSESVTVSDEDWTQGVNRPLLSEIAGTGNGRMLDGDEPWPELLSAPARQSVTRFWQPLSTAATLALVVAVLLSSMGRKW